ncbi:hypothetical protein E3P92_03122 [Wallemia ichthyophaga]|nr:hypothetical protein E3P92_03122 [Wallemia ichthyophaga]
MKFALIALAAAASAVPLNRRQDSHVNTSNLDKLRDENNSLPESGVYRLDIVPGRKEGESSIELVPDENGSIIFQNNESEGMSKHGNGTAVVDSHKEEEEDQDQD